jgi:hypothetical protein
MAADVILEQELDPRLISLVRQCRPSSYIGFDAEVRARGVVLWPRPGRSRGRGWVVRSALRRRRPPSRTARDAEVRRAGVWESSAFADTGYGAGRVPLVGLHEAPRCAS